MPETVIPVVAILMPLFLVPTIILLKQAGRKREWEHRERMKALELGLPVPGSEAWTGRAAIAVGGIMPVGVFAVAWLASVSSHHPDESPWLAAAIVGGLGVFCGARLVGSLAGRRGGDESAEAAVRPAGLRKPAFNPDAYDAIARHG